MLRQTTIVIVDYHAMVRQALAARLQAEQDMLVVATGADAHQAISLVIEYSPDLVIMDMDMPGKSCFEATEIIRQHKPNTRVLFLSASCHDTYVDQAIKVQVDGYLVKNESIETVIQGIRHITAGKTCYSATVQSRMIRTPARRTGNNQLTRSRASLLSPRERQVLQYLANGLSAKDIASAMTLSVRTVDRHRANIMNKLDIHDRVKLSNFAQREGLVVV